MRPRGLPTVFLCGLLALFAPRPGAGQDEMRWRLVEPGRTVYMMLDEGEVVIELNPRFAPKTVERFTELVQADFYRGLSFYRVIEGFVAQGGDESDVGVPPTQPTLDGEFDLRWDDELPWTPVQRNDLYRADTGYIDGFASARAEGRVWLTHCPGVVAMARAADPDSARTDFYIVIGQAPRYLDRNLTVFGRVIHGMDVVQRIRRGPTEMNGIIESDLARSRILRMHMAPDLPAEERDAFYVMDTNSPGFRAYLEQRRERDDDFFLHTPPPVLDVCQVPVATRVEKPDVPDVLLRSLQDPDPQAQEEG